MGIMNDLPMDATVLLLPKSIQPIELVWTLIGLIGLFHSAPILWQFLCDAKILRQDGINGGDRIIANQNIGVGLSICFIHVIVVLIGVTSMLITPTIQSPQQVSATGIVITVGLIAIILLLDFIAWWLAVSHLRLRLYLRSVFGAERLSHHREVLEQVEQKGKE